MTAAFRIMVGVGLAGALTFMAMYAIMTRRWHRSAVGRLLMAEALVLAGLLGLSLASAVWRVPDWVWLGGMGLLDAVLWIQVWVLWRANTQPHRRMRP